MNFKKIAITAAAAGVMLASAMPAFASLNIGFGNGDIEQSNRAFLFNRVTTQANTGGNRISGAVVLGSDIDTGNATAISNVLNDVNGNLVDGCGCRNFNIGISNGDIEQSNSALVINSVTTQANTGGNSVSGFLVLGSDIDTGNAGAQGVVTNFVNTNIVR